MLTALTAYFYFLAVFMVLVWIISLVYFPEPKAPPKRSTGELIAYGAGVLLLTAAITAPWYYLQVIGLEALSLPGWIAWIMYGLSLLTQAVNLARNRPSSGSVNAFPLYTVLLAWYGLQALIA